VHRVADLFEGRQLLRGLSLCSAGRLTTDPVDRAVARRRDDPRAGVVRDAVARPALERDDERVLDRLLGAVEVAERARQGRDRLPGLAPEQAVDGGPGCAQVQPRLSVWACASGLPIAS
jgi:hypothetical protein